MMKSESFYMLFSSEEKETLSNFGMLWIIVSEPEKLGSVGCLP